MQTEIQELKEASERRLASDRVEVSVCGCDYIVIQYMVKLNDMSSGPSSTYKAYECVLLKDHCECFLYNMSQRTHMN